MRTPSVVVAILGTEFTLEVAEDNATTVTVLKGTVDVQDRISGSNATITANQKLTVPNVPGGLTPQEMSALITEVAPASIDRWWEPSAPSTYSVTIETPTGGSTNPPAETYAQDVGTTLAVTAYPHNGYTLNHWLLDGNNVGNSNPYTVHFDSNHTLQPIFTQGGPSLPAFPLLPGVGVAGVVIVLIAVVVALRRHRRKPRASSPGENARATENH